MTIGMVVMTSGHKKYKQETVLHVNPPVHVVPPETPVTPPPPVKPIEPKWTSYPAIRQVSNLGKVLSDIESHMPANHMYRDKDKITWAHETTHGLASNIRQKYSSGGLVELIEGLQVYKSADRINGFYVLNDRAIVLHEPNGTLSQVAKTIPSDLRGDVYDLYFRKQVASWDSCPLYTCDEWVAYSNGSATRADLKISDRAETVQYMMEFSLYAICMTKACNPDQDVKEFVKWHVERTVGLMRDNQSLGNSKAVAYWSKVKGNTEIRQFCEEYFGKEWCQRVWAD